MNMRFTFNVLFIANLFLGVVLFFIWIGNHDGWALVFSLGNLVMAAVNYRSTDFYDKTSDG
jgi:hypothetical protein